MPKLGHSRYKAANWLYLGKTRGRGRMDHHHEAHGRAVKRIYVYQLCRDAQQRLTQDSAPAGSPEGTVMVNVYFQESVLLRPTSHCVLQPCNASRPFYRYYGLDT